MNLEILNSKELGCNSMRNADITEHFPDTTKSGHIEYNGHNGDGSHGIGWRQTGCGNRTTLFHPGFWNARVDGDAIVLERTAEGAPGGLVFDMPPREARKYSIQLAS